MLNILKEKKLSFYTGIVLLVILGAAFLFDRALGVGLLLVTLLTIITFLIIYKNGAKNRVLYILFLIVLFTHLGATLFFHYADFQPFSGGVGDYIVYNQEAQRISQGLHQGTFSLKEVIFDGPSLQITNYYSLVVGFIYRLTLPEMIIGELFNAWLIALSVLFVFLITKEITNSERWAFLIGLIINIYPSYTFYGGLLLKEALFVCLILAGLFLIIKSIKNFSWRNFLIFYIVLIIATNLRFYIGYVLLFTFIFSLFLLFRLKPKEKIIYGMIILLLLGFVPEIAANQGFYGINTYRDFLNQEVITYYREEAYVYQDTVSIPPHKRGANITVDKELASPSLTLDDPRRGEGSTVVIKTRFDNPPIFLKNNLESFINVILGPFPWQIKYTRQLLALFETIPWYFLLFFIIKGVLRSIKERRRTVFPLIFFSLLTFGVLAIYIDNFGILTRVRMSAFIALSCLIPFSFRDKQIKN